MSSNTSRRQAAREFVKEWTGKGYEKGETQRFWLSLLHNVFGIDDPMKMMEFELPVKTFAKDKGSDFIDGYITPTRVLIEQKGSHVNLAAKARQSDGLELTPYQQARRYVTGLPLSMAPRWIVVCNFTSFEVHDMERPNDAPETIELKDLEREYHRLSFLVDDTSVHLKRELEVSIQAGEIVGLLYDKILSQYRDPSSPESRKSLNKLCVRLVFCLYAEDAGIFGGKNMFHDYMYRFDAGEFREKLIKLFRILNTPVELRDPYEDEALLAFPYVNGGMFAGDIEIPRFTEEIRTLILQRASDGFDWSEISPTIFGAVFESTLNPETRRAGGMHYTSIENIHKVIDPLFLDGLNAELSDIKATPVAKARREKAIAFQDKLAGLKFLDPACGSGNFLTESYTSLRRLENEAIRIIWGDNRVIGELADPIKVSVSQFHGIEINDFACSVAQTALWIAESQMMAETDEIAGFNLDPLPLKTYSNIREGNALRMDWNEVVPATELDYLMGNPPFIGYSLQSKGQKEDLLFLSPDMGKNIDYVAGWYVKAADMIKDNSTIRAALVSTNSITQGEQPAVLWKELLRRNPSLSINFAHRTFRWDSEASNKAHVHCVIVGFGNTDNSRQKRLYSVNDSYTVENINPYLTSGPTVLISSRKRPVCGVPEIVKGSSPVDGGNLIIEAEDHDTFIKREPESSKFIRRFVGAREFLHNIPRYCLWLQGASPAELVKLPLVKERVRLTREFRLSSSKEATRKYADYPMRFMEIRQPNSEYIIIPRHSSEARKYIPMGYMSKDVVCGDANILIPDAALYHFGILESSIHMAWMRTVCGRLEMRYRYSKDIVYNNFPWPQEVSVQPEGGMPGADHLPVQGGSAAGRPRPFPPSGDYPAVSPEQKLKIERSGSFSASSASVGYPVITETQKRKIEQTAQGILDARALYPDSSLADLYDNLTMPPELRRAHRANDEAVLQAYGFPKDTSEGDIVARLFAMYQKLTEE